MNLKRQIVSEAEHKSRRFSKGVHCLMLSDSFRVLPQALSTVLRLGLLPAGTVKVTKEFKEHGYDPESCYMVLLPYSKLEEFRELLASATDRDQVEQGRLLAWCRQNLIMARAAGNDHTRWNALPRWDQCDVLVSGLDTLQNVEVTLIPKSESLDPIEWTSKNDQKKPK